MLIRRHSHFLILELVGVLVEVPAASSSVDWGGAVEVSGWWLIHIRVVVSDVSHHRWIDCSAALSLLISTTEKGVGGYLKELSR